MVVDAGMKRKILIPAFLFVLIVSLEATDLGATSVSKTNAEVATKAMAESTASPRAKPNVTLNFEMTKGARVLEARFNSEVIQFNIALKQKKDGMVELQMPPFFSINVKNVLKIGEIRDARIFSVLINPSLDVDLSGGFKKGGNVKQIESLSMKPALSGFALNFKYLDLIALNPILNKKSPIGFGAIAGNSKVFAGVMVAGQNDMTLKAFPEIYQLDWGRTGAGRTIIFSILGAVADGQIASLKVKSYAFVQNAWDIRLGGEASTGYYVKVDTGSIYANLQRKLLGSSPRLKIVGVAENPDDEIQVGVGMSGRDLEMYVEYGSMLYGRPIYGGSSQRRVIELKTEVKTNYFSFKVVHSTNFEENFGKVSESKYEIRTEVFGAKLSLKTTMDRRIESPCQFINTTIGLTTKYLKFSFGNDGVCVELSFEVVTEEWTVRFSIDQDRMVKASVRFQS